MKLREWLKSQSRISCCLILIKRAYLSDLDQIIKSYFLSCSVQESGLSFMIGFVIEIVVSEKIYQDSRADSNCQILVKITQNIVIILNGNINISVKQNDKIF